MTERISIILNDLNTLYEFASDSDGWYSGFAKEDVKKMERLREAFPQILQDHEIVNRLIKQIEEFKEKDFGYCMSTLLEIRDGK